LLHDGWRHIIFVYPSLIVLATLGWIYLEQFFRKDKRKSYLLWAILAVALLEPAFFIAKNYSYPYIYFNPIGGGLKGAHGNFETDYWAISAKKAVKWMEKEGIIGPEMQDTVTIGTHFYYNVSRQIPDSYKDRVKVKYVRFYRRYAESWDYGIFPTRFIRGPHLRSGNWPNSKTVHVVEANGIPLTAIEKEEEQWTYQAEEAAKKQDWAAAFTAFNEEVKAHPDNELAWMGLSNVYINTNNLTVAIEAAKESLKYAPENENGLYYMGLAYMRSGKMNAALECFHSAIKTNKDHYVSHYYAGIIYQQRKEYQQALKHALETVRANKAFKQGYILVAGIYNDIGDKTNAQRYQNFANQLK